MKIGKARHAAALGTLLLVAGCAGQRPLAEDDTRGMLQRLEEQERRLASQSQELDRQRQELDRLRGSPLDEMRGAGTAPLSVPPASFFERPGKGRTPPLHLAQSNAAVIPPPAEAGPERQSAAAPPPPLTAAPGTQPPRREATPREADKAPRPDPPPPAASVAPEASVQAQVSLLTPKGKMIFDPSLELTHSSSNRLVFRGVEVVPGIQIGVIDANDADRNAVIASLGARYGIADRWEVEARAPYVYRSDRVTTVQQRDQQVTRTIDISGSSIGDAEFAVRHQLNNKVNGWPYFIANLRAKADTGTGPYDIKRDRFGIAEEVTTGSGFWGIEPSLTVLFPSDPAVLYGNLSYTWNVARDIDKDIGGVRVGRVDPGDQIGVSFGLGFSLNPDLSLSLGYKHAFIGRTSTELNSTTQRSNSIQLGSLMLGVSYKISDRVSISTNFEFGMTKEAPDVRAVLRVPITFGVTN